jgi:cytochrome c peroxidase
MLRLSMHTRLARHGRHRCQACHRRRLAFSIVADSPGGAGRAESPRLCASCAGLTLTGAEPTSVDDVIAATELSEQ